jgi:hypothetical protein
MGPKPYPSCTLHRVVNDLPAYGPGLCQWAGKVEQNNNKSDNIQLVEPVTGVVWTPLKLAKLHGVSVQTIYKRINSFWSILELLGGKKSPSLRDLWVKLDELPKPEPKGPKKVLRPITQVPSLQQFLDSQPIDEDYYDESGKIRVKNFNEICDEYDAVIDWVNAFNAGLPLPPLPNLKFLKNFLVKMTPERVALRFTPTPPEPKPAPTYSYKHDPAECMPEDEYDHDGDDGSDP